MFPGMQGPQALPDPVAYPMFWKNLNTFITITTVTILVAATIRACDKNTHSMLVSAL